MEQTAISPNARTEHIGNATMYLSLLYIGTLVCVLGAATLRGGGAFAVVVLVLGVAAILAAQVYYFVLFYQVWRFVINESRRRQLVPSIETPGKAIGFLFIPFFNLYWMFMAFGKLPKDFNALAKAAGSHFTMSTGLGITIPILLIVSIIPVLGYVATFVTLLILYPIYMTQAIRVCKSCGEAGETSAVSAAVS